MELNFNEIRELLAVLQQTDIAELSIKSSDFELSIRKDRAVSDRPPEPAFELPPLGASPAPVPTPAAVPTPPPKADRLLEVVSPMVGTFYRAPGPRRTALCGRGRSHPR
ncbi:MAG: acetyl-CoA carboxylase, biotin carboxyl carrier protein, partial [Leptolyngbyaceae cyanobacterium SM1_3_5]|nr:acetyl-CoA carboxylase, biotin carboxyl carrier protein [Leptolyngbyaceae cyanobacterium SM1_3_5]